MTVVIWQNLEKTQHRLSISSPGITQKIVGRKITMNLDLTQTRLICYMISHFESCFVGGAFDGKHIHRKDF